MALITTCDGCGTAWAGPECPSYAICSRLREKQRECAEWQRRMDPEPDVTEAREWADYDPDC